MQNYTNVDSYKMVPVSVQKPAPLEDRLFTKYTDPEILRGIINDMYLGMKNDGLPSLEDLIDLVTEYNEDLALEMAYGSLDDECLECLDRHNCWKDGKVGGDLINDQMRCDCESSFMEMTLEHLSYNYAYYDIEELIIATVYALGYAMILPHKYTDMFYGDVPVLELSGSKLIFNDCQIKSFPEFEEDIGFRIGLPDGSEAKLMLAP